MVYASNLKQFLRMLTVTIMHFNTIQLRDFLSRQSQAKTATKIERSINHNERLCKARLMLDLDQTLESLTCNY